MTFWGILIGLITIALSAFGYVMKKAGKDASASNIGKTNEKLQKKYSKIDRENPDLDASLDRLRKRSRDKRPGS